MIDLKSIPLYYIAFKQDPQIEQHYRSHGFKNIKHFEAVNGRKMSIKKLLKENIISIRSYNDLVFGRREHSGIPSLGAVGCTLSHYELWNLCVNQNWAFIIIAEEDNRLNKLTNKDIDNIQKIINKPRGMFVSAKITNEEHRKHFFGTHFCILSQEACKVLIAECFPMNVQTDWYIAHMGTRDKITLEGFPVSKQMSNGTTIQDSCILCFLPKDSRVYWISIGVLLLLIIITVSVIKWYKNCQNDLGECLNK